MATAKIDPTEVLRQLERNGTYQKCPKEFQNAFRPFVLSLPKILEDMLENIADGESIYLAKTRFLMHCYDMGVDNSFESCRFDFGTWESVKLLFGRLGEFKFMKVNNRSTLADLKLDVKAGELFLKRELTIGQLLLLDPFSIIRNPSIDLWLMKRNLI